MTTSAQSPHVSVSFFRPLRNLWHRLLLPPQPSIDATAVNQEKYRRIKIASIIIQLVFLSVLIGFLFAVVIGTSSFALVVLAFVALIALLALLFLRGGQIVTAGVLFVGLYTIGIVVSYSLLPNGLDVSQVIGYDILLIAVLLAAIFFPAWSVFLVASFNSAFILYNFYTQPHSPLLTQFVQERGGYVAIERTLFLEFIVAILVYMLVNSATKALLRAERAEQVSRLVEALAQRDRNAAKEKEQLENSVQQIVAVLTHYANGNWTARVPLDQNNVLWNIGGALNNLLARLLHLRQENHALREAYMRSAPTMMVDEQISVAQHLSDRPKSEVPQSRPFPFLPKNH